MKTLAAIYAAQGNDDKALEVQQEYLSKSKKATNNDWATLANTYIAKADGLTDRAAKNAVLAKALDVYEQMVAKFPTISDWVWLNQANVAQLMNDPDKVAEIYQRLLHTKRQSQRSTKIARATWRTFTMVLVTITQRRVISLLQTSTSTRC